MGVDVGVVKISYLDRPGEPTYGFLWWLAALGGCNEWGGGWDGNAFVEIERKQLLSKAGAYAREQGMGHEELEQLLAWVRGLPWDGSAIMLHFNW